ncbi:MAG: rRNA maturation RNase YbeY [Candidatus Shikimatogenerans sp. JK-2022]|nr:rRNA maturation RNase YbeY [Candidatus Shikimatogenerans bostrichidophilus]
MINIYLLKKIIINNIKIFKKKINYIIKNENKNIYLINYIFCNNKYILFINKKFLNKKKFTDTITFNYNNNKINNIIYGDIFISVDQVYLNSLLWKTKFNKEIKRVILHSLLHLIGYNDNNKINKHIMTKKENYYLKKIKLINIKQKI